MSVGGNDPIGREHNSSHKKDCRKIATFSEPQASFYPYSTTKLNLHYINPGAPGAGQRGHFRLSTWILRDTEVIATNDFFQKEGAPFSDR